MNQLIAQIKQLEKSPLRDRIKQRLADFSEMGKKDNDSWFSELCFCILTANSKARTAIAIQEQLGISGFLHCELPGLCKVIRDNKHRFHNNKSRFIVEARKFCSIKDIIKKQDDPRAWLVENIKGLGWKEASHFLRNVGYSEYAILDRHVINLMLEAGMIRKKPQTLNKKTYLEIEKKLNSFAERIGMKPDELDLYMWYMKGGDVLK